MKSQPLRLAVDSDQTIEQLERILKEFNGEIVDSTLKKKYKLHRKQLILDMRAPVRSSLPTKPDRT